MQIEIGHYGKLSTTGNNIFTSWHVAAIAYYEKDLAFVSFMAGSSEANAIAANISLRNNVIFNAYNPERDSYDYRGDYMAVPEIKGAKSLTRYTKRIADMRLDNIVIMSNLFKVSGVGTPYVFSDENLAGRLREIMPFAIPDEWLDTFIQEGKIQRLIKPMRGFGLQAYVISLENEKWQAVLRTASVRHKEAFADTILKKLPE